ncbi:hypothetical protein ABIF83_002535 [Bradyrhizobium ottawaense]
MTEVEGEAPGADHIRGEAGRPPQHRAQPRQQLLDGKRFGQIVVGAAIEPGDAVGDLAARRQHDDRHPVGAGPQLRDQGETVAIGKLAIEQDGGVDVGRNGLLRLGERRGMVHHHVVALQRRRQRVGHFGLVLDEQNPHDPAPQPHPCHSSGRTIAAALREPVATEWP